VPRTFITVGVTGPGGKGGDDVVALLSADPECRLVPMNEGWEAQGGWTTEGVPDLLIVDTGAALASSLEELLGDLTRSRAAILVVAPDERYALEAHQLHVCSYLTRPLGPEPFSQALDWAKVQIRRRSIEEQSLRLLVPNDAGGPRRVARERLMVKSHNHIHLIKLDDIDWIEANAGYSWIHAQGKKLLLRGKMKCLEENLPGDRFVRIHRSLIVNIDRIRELQQVARGEYHAILGDGTQLTVSRSYRGRLFSAFGKAS